MWDFTVDSLMKSWWPMAAALEPSARSSRTSCSRVDRRVDSALIRRIIAPARPVHRNERGETAACRAARTTSDDGASLPTKAEAPASMAAKIWSSPECMMTTTSPMVSSFARTCRMMSRPVPSWSWRSVTITSGRLSAYTATASETVPTEPTTSVPTSRAKAPTRPSRMSSWSSTIRTWRAAPSVLIRAPPVGRDSCQQRVGPDDLLRLRHAGPVEEAYRHHGAVRSVVEDLELAVDQGGALAHDLEPVGVVAARTQPVAVVSHHDLGRRGSDPAGHVDRGRAGVADRVGHRLLRDPQQLALYLGAQPRRQLVEGDVDRDATAPRQMAGQGADGRSQGVVLTDLGAQGLHRTAYLSDHHRQPLAQHRELTTALGAHRLLVDQGVDEVAEGGHLLCDAVVHLARQTPPLLDGRGVAERQEQHRRVEPDRGWAERAVQCRESPGEVHRLRVEARREYAEDDRGHSATAVER